MEEAAVNNLSSTTSKKSPKPRRVNKQKRINSLSKEQLRLALQKKRECNGKAQRIVEELIEQNVDPESFIEKLIDINQSHYDDITEERSIIKLCGYPLCRETLTDIPSKKYHISTTTNKVYEITERKKFCSNMCFKSSNYLKEQLLTSPLWLRDQEIVPVIRLLPHKNESQGKESQESEEQESQGKESEEQESQGKESKEEESQGNENSVTVLTKLTSLTLEDSICNDAKEL